jgi:uncharacterized protein involved in exopolysaccharide biosynthesis
MGIFWDTFQQVQIHKRKKETTTLEERVSALEEEVDFLGSILEETLQKLEQLTGQDFDGDGRAPGV